MKTYKVWDELNGEEGMARNIDARTPKDAAETYAEKDTDGHWDALYKDAHPMPVRSPEGKLHCFEVQVAYKPIWRAVPCE